LPCAEQAQGILAARLAQKANVSCRFPGAAREDGAAICLDGDGVDLAGMLVAEGLALADPAQSYDYVGAESVARSQKRGLWLFR
jgi:endonuclease YncB( thermonuclease family)